MTSSYRRLIKKIFNLPKGTSPPEEGFQRMQRLCSLYNNPQLGFPTIHIAGTNGKGSTCTKIASALTAHGYKTGLYTSPHISSFCERIRINNLPISQQKLVSLYQSLSEKPASFFEIATLLAFLHFREQQVDVAVIETGLGGTYDATNVIQPILSVITSIGFDHCDILGQSLEQICQAKAGILKPNTPGLLGPFVPLSLICAPDGCTLHTLKPTSEHYELENRRTAQKALELISHSFPISNRSLQIGLEATAPCRFEIIHHKKTVVLDVAHNPQGFERLIERLRHTFSKTPFRFICAFSKGKDIAMCAKLIESCTSKIHLPKVSYPRLATSEEIAPSFHVPVLIEPSISKAIANALSSPPTNETLVIAGSLYMMDEAKKALSKGYTRST